jgi:hypothetical protein
MELCGLPKARPIVCNDSPAFQRNHRSATCAAESLTFARLSKDLVAYVTINKTNYPWFEQVAVVCGVLEFVAIVRFDRIRQRHVKQIPIVGLDGRQLVDSSNRPVSQSIVVGLEADIREPAKTELAEAKKKDPSLSVLKFMSGFGSNPYDPEALWDSVLLADIRNNLTTLLMSILIFGVIHRIANHRGCQKLRGCLLVCPRHRSVSYPTNPRTV